MLEILQLSTQKLQKICGSCGKVCLKPQNAHFEPVENTKRYNVESVENFLEVYIIRKDGRTAQNAGNTPFVSNFKNIDL